MKLFFLFLCSFSLFVCASPLDQLVASCKKGHGPSCFTLGQGAGSDLSPIERGKLALEYYRTGCEAKHMGCCFNSIFLHYYFSDFTAAKKALDSYCSLTKDPKDCYIKTVWENCQKHDEASCYTFESARPIYLPKDKAKIGNPSGTVQKK